MTFSTEQLANLRAPLISSHVKEREQSGRKLSYIEGWHAEAEANRIFGEHAWDSTIIDLKCVSERSRKIGKGQYEKDGWGVTYTCTVRVQVTTPDGHTIIRDGAGAGHGIDADVGLAHESALKEAATDAEKRALKTFGNPFGLALYDKTRANVASAEESEGAVMVDLALAAIDLCADRPSLDKWKADNADMLARTEAENVMAFNKIVRAWKSKAQSYQKEAA